MALFESAAQQLAAWETSVAPAGWADDRVGPHGASGRRCWGRAFCNPTNAVSATLVPWLLSVNAPLSRIKDPASSDLLPCVLLLFLTDSPQVVGVGWLHGATAAVLPTILLQKQFITDTAGPRWLPKNLNYYDPN